MMDRMAALASNVVASTPIVLPLMRPAPSSTPSTQVNTAWCVSTSINRRVLEIVEWSGVSLLAGTPRKSRRLSESAARQAMPRSLSIPSKYPNNRHRKYTPGARPGRPTFLA